MPIKIEYKKNPNEITKNIPKENPKILSPKSGEVKNQIKIAGIIIKNNKNKDLVQADDLLILIL